MAYVPFGSLGGVAPAQSMQAPAVEQNFLQQVAGSPGFGNALQALGMSLMSSPSNNPLAGFAPALQQNQAQSERERQVAMQEEERAAAEAEKSQWAQYAQSVVPEQLRGLAQTDPKGALTIWQQMQPQSADPTANMREYEYARQTGFEGSFADWVGGGGAGRQPTVSTQPQYFTDPATGQTRLGQLSSTGEVVWSDTNGYIPLTPGDMSQQRSYGTEAGKGQYAAESGLGSAEIVAETANNAIDRLRDNTQGQSEQFGNVLGIPQQMLPVLPGTPRANFQVDLEQANGQAFLQAREFLKGQGQITDFESRRAEAAFSRLEKAAQMGDQGSFNDALNDFQTAVNQGLEKVQKRAGVSATQPDQQQPIAPPSTGQTSSGLTWSATP